MTKFTYRIANHDDVPALVRLWERETTWGPLDAETWRSWHCDTPDGNWLVMVAEDEAGEICGQMAYMPTRILMGEAHISALRAASPIIKRELRSVGAIDYDHPIRQLSRAGISEARSRGVQLIYALPAPSWLPYFQAINADPRTQFRYAIAKYGCARLDIAQKPQAPKSHVYVAPLNGGAADVDEIWAHAVASFSIRAGAVRTGDAVVRRHREHLLLAVRAEKGDAMLGFVAIRERDALIMDVLSREPAMLADVLSAAVHWLAEHKPEIGEARGIAAMVTPAIAAPLQQLGFAPNDYTFSVAATSIDARLNGGAVHPRHWYVTPGD